MSTDTTTLGVIASLEIAHALLTLQQHGNVEHLLAPGVNPVNAARGHTDTVLRALRGSIDTTGNVAPGQLIMAAPPKGLPRTDDDARVMAQKLAPRAQPYLSENELKKAIGEVAEKANAVSKSG